MILKAKATWLIIIGVALCAVATAIWLLWRPEKEAIRVSGQTAIVESLQTHLAEHQGYWVAYQNGLPIPSFDTWRLDNSSRDYLSLHGDWQFRYEYGLDCLNEEPGCFAAEYDDSEWESQQVPFNADMYNRGQFEEEYGNYWYRKTFFMDEQWEGKFVRLMSLGIYHQSHVYINGVLAGSNQTGYTPFSFDISPYLKYGEQNVIAVHAIRKDPLIIDNAALPSSGFDWWDYTGITRDLFLEASEPLTITKIVADASALRQELAAQIVVFNHTNKPQTVQLSVEPGFSGGEIQQVTESLEAEEVRVIPVRWKDAKLEPWMPESPVLYEMKASLQNGDSLAAVYGAVDMEVSGTQLLVQGEPVFLKGVNWHEENAMQGRVMEPEHYTEEYNLIKSTGANYIRNAHYNRHPIAYEYANQTGLFMMDEIENYWLNLADIKEQYRNDKVSKGLAISMAWNQINHPSVLLWSLANESETNNEDAVLWLSEMREAIRLIDPKLRPVTYASNSLGADMSMEVADVISINEYFGYFTGDKSDYGVKDLSRVLLRLHEAYPDKPFIITENGSWSDFGRRGSAEEGGTEDWHAANFAAHWDETVSHPHIVGYTFWNWKDYRSNRDYSKNNAARLSMMGLVEWYSLKPRLVFHYFQSAGQSGVNRIIDPGMRQGVRYWQGLPDRYEAAPDNQSHGVRFPVDAEEELQVSQKLFGLLPGKFVLSMEAEAQGEAVVSLEVRLDQSGSSWVKAFDLGKDGYQPIELELELDEGRIYSGELIIRVRSANQSTVEFANVQLIAARE